MPIKIEIVSDVAKAVGGVKDLGGEFDKVADSLDDLIDQGKDAEKALDWGTPDSLEKVDDGVKDATDSTEKLEKKFKDAADTVKKIDGKSVRDLDDDFKRAEQGAEEFGDESTQIAKETATSFDGTAESISDVFRDLAANAFAGFGPAGVAAGVAVAAGLGLAQAKLEEIAEKTNESAEAAGSWAQEFNKATDAEGRIDALASSFEELSTTIVDDKQWFEVWQDEATTAIEAVVDGYEAAGRSLNDFASAFNQDDPKRRAEALREEETALQAQADAYNDLNQAAANRFDVDEARRLGELRDQTQAAADEIGRQADVQEKANKITDAAAAAEGDHADSLRETTEAIQEKNDATRESMSAELDWLDTLAGLTKAVEENGTSLNKNSARGRENIRYLIDAADAVDDLYDTVLAETGSQERAASARDKASRELRQQAVDAGYSKREIDKLLGSINRTPRSKTTDIKVNTREGEKDIRDFINSAPSDVGIGVRANTAQANQDVANFRHSQQSIPITIGLRAV
ncbi:hypothetical protein [Promicromonospora kroppenstedtii]|uniref:hypothetical protein n=1 Tax=Promicromonospora kroppenstedtii TaxID=440482 RepID=UPI00055BD43C|nr:hypothetical protein [Promicromonospora kroppenstedtii]